MNTSKILEGDDPHPLPSGSTIAHPTPIVRSPIEIDDMALFRAAFDSLIEPISDASFAISLGWGEALELSYAIIEEHLCLFSAADGDLSMMLPPHPLTRTGDALLGSCLERCFAIMDEHNGANAAGRSRIEYVSDEMLDRIRACDTPALSASPMPGDYVYSRSAMVELAGGPLKAKRKLRSRFIRENPGFTIAPITPDDLKECHALLRLWRAAADERHEGEANERLIGTDILRQRDELFTRCVLDHLDVLGLESLLVRVDGRLVGFTIGERLTPDQAVIYVEKTDPSVVGTPQFIFSKFCEINFADVSEINVGDDWGIESLRYTKMSYRPSRMISKSLLTRQPVPEHNAIDPVVEYPLRPIRSLSKLDRIDPVFTQASTQSPEPISIRSATRADANTIVELEERTFPEDDRFSVRQIRRMIDNPRAIVLVAQTDGLIVGWIVSLIRTHRRWRSGRIYSVAVSPGHKGNGIGRSLVARSIEQLSELGIDRVYLEVRHDNTPAITLYESFGFTPIANLADYYAEGVAGVRMRRVGRLTP